MEGPSTADLLTVETTELREGVVVMRLAGEVDMSSVDLMAEQFEALASGNKMTVIVDASKVTFMDSTGLHALVEGKRVLHEAGTQIFLVPSSQVRRVLELVFPEPLFAARLNTVDEAIAALGPTA
jgi:anti-sigma B factor antagonist